MEVGSRPDCLKQFSLSNSDNERSEADDSKEKPLILNEICDFDPQNLGRDNSC